jgi:hypothetical protein
MVESATDKEVAMNELAIQEGAGEDVPNGTARDLVYLLRCVLDREVPDARRVARMDVGSIHLLASRHMVAAACSMALESAGVCHPALVEARGKAVRKTALMDVERGRLFRRMDRLGIWHVPLKGAVLQAMYPAYGMRQMSDNDILFDASRADEVREVMEGMGFSCEDFGSGTDDVYHKRPVLNFEMHRSLFTNAHDPNLCAYYRDVWRLLVPDGDGTCGMHFSNEEFYAYMVAHEWKHYSQEGTGLRSLMDTFVWLRHKGESMDWDHVRASLDALGIAGFEERNRKLAVRLFSGEDLDEGDEAMLAYVVESGAYGTFGHGVDNVIRRRVRLGFIAYKLFPPMGVMRVAYPVLDSAPFLLPACWLARFAVVLAKRPGNATRYIGAVLRRRDG